VTLRKSSSNARRETLWQDAATAAGVGVGVGVGAVVRENRNYSERLQSMKHDR